MDKTNIDDATKFEVTPIISPPPATKYKKFLIPITMTPANGVKINTAIIAGMSPKSSCKNDGKNGNGNFKKNNRKEIVPSKAKTTIFNTFEDSPVKKIFPLHLLSILIS